MKLQKHFARKMIFIISILIVLACLFAIKQAYKDSKNLVYYSVHFIDTTMETFVKGPYTPKKSETFSLAFVNITEKEKQEIIAATKSLIDNKYYELGNTLYATKVSFHKTSLVIEVSPIYTMKVVEKFGLSDLHKGSDRQFIQQIQTYVQKHYRYLNVGTSAKSLSEFLKDKEGQCNSFAELFYLLAKHRGLEVRIQVNGYHAWNLVKLNGVWEKVDLSLNLPIGGDAIEVK